MVAVLVVQDCVLLLVILHVLVVAEIALPNAEIVVI